MTSALYRLTEHHIYTIHLSVGLNAILHPTQLEKPEKRKSSDGFGALHKDATWRWIHRKEGLGQIQIDCGCDEIRALDEDSVTQLRCLSQRATVLSPLVYIPVYLHFI